MSNTSNDVTSVMSVKQFCESHQISRAFFENLKRRGEAPVYMQIGRRILISSDAAAAWRERFTVPPKAHSEAKGGA